MSSSSSSLSKSKPFVVLLLDSDALGVNPVEVSLAKKKSKKINKKNLKNAVTFPSFKLCTCKMILILKNRDYIFVYYLYIKEVNNHSSCNLHPHMY